MATKKSVVETVEATESIEATTSEVPVELIEQLIQEMTQRPALALKFIQSLGKITKPWETLSRDGTSINEVPVPQGKPAKEFLKETQNAGYVSGYRLSTIFGDEVAIITKDSPKWRVTILGDYQVEAPFMTHPQKGEASVKQFVEEKVRKLGYIIPS